MPRRIATLATCNLNQWALDFDGNLERVKRSVEAAREAGATYRVGPELELTGYGCEDHFLEPDTEDHAWRCLAELLCSGVGGGGGDRVDVDESRRRESNTSSTSTPPILLDVGLVATHAGARYNVRVFCLGTQVLLVRPKSALADDGNYRESRYFRAWRPSRGLETFKLPRGFVETMQEMSKTRSSTRQGTAPIGHAILELDDATLAAESCEELFTPCPPHVALALAGCEVVSNGSGSHHQLRKLDEQRLSLLQDATKRCGGVYLYANQRGCDGGRLYYDGCACVVSNGKLVAQGTQFGLADVEVVAANVDLDDVVAFRGGIASAQEQAASSGATTTPPPPPRIRVRHRLCRSDSSDSTPPTPPPPLYPSPPIQQPRIHLPEEEIAFGPAAWLWDYLRRSGAGGFLLPLSGGADSASVAAIVGAMCQMVAKSAVVLRDEQVREDARRITGIDLVEEMKRVKETELSSSEEEKNDDGDKIVDPSDQALSSLARSLSQRVLTTVYLASSEVSGPETRARAASLASEVGSEHRVAVIDGVVEALLAAACEALGDGSREAGEAAATKATGKGDASVANGDGTPCHSRSPPAPRPRFAADGGSRAESLALQNVQARSRMVLAFLMAQLGPWAAEKMEEEVGGGPDAADATTKSRRPRGFRLVLGAANVDEALRGYLTKYDCSAADLNPIGGVSKVDLRKFLRWAADGLGYPSLADIERAPPTAELEPTRTLVAGDGRSPPSTSSEAPRPPPPQTDEADMGMTYAELSEFGRLRAHPWRCGPVSTFEKLLASLRASKKKETSSTLSSPRQAAERVKAFWGPHSANRHKQTTLTPSYHAESYSPDDNRFDLRPFLYRSAWPWQFRRIDRLAEEAEKREGRRGGEEVTI